MRNLSIGLRREGVLSQLLPRMEVWVEMFELWVGKGGGSLVWGAGMLYDT